MSRPTVRKIAAAIAVILAALLIFSVVVPAMMGSASAAVTKADLDRLKAQASDLSKQSKKAAAELSKVRADKASAIKQKNIIDEQINVLQDQIDTSNAIIQGLSEQIADKETEIAAAEEKEAQEFELFKKRVRAMEENGTASYWGVLLKAESFSDLLARAEVINEIITYDKDLMADLKTTREGIESAKAELESDKADQDAAKANLEQQKIDLETKYSEQNVLLKDLEKAEREYSKDFEAAEEEMARVNKEIAKMAAELARQSKYVGGKYLWPVPGKDSSDISSPYGNRKNPITHKYSLHTGIDIAAPKGTPVVAANNGKIIISGWNTAYGNYIVISHGGGQTTLYGHMSKLLVKKGEEVKRGDKIGLVGSTGWSTGPHLHFEISINGKTVNPMNYFK
jgi:murein DD-endopeptidase MepM/ murein hydrolase activator NlpD